MTFFVLASVRPAPAWRTEQRDDRTFWLESWDGVTVLPINGDSPLRMRTGASGWGAAPTTLALSAAPGVAGSTVDDVTVGTRQVLFPFVVRGSSQAQTRDWVQRLRDLTDPTHGMTREGNFRIVCSTSTGTRQIGLGYQSGLEGDAQDLPTFESGVLSLVAPQPFAEDRDALGRDFALADEVTSFLGGRWGEVGLSTSQLLSSGGPVELFSAVPVWPDLAVEGPVTSLHITSDTGMDVQVTSAIEAGEVLTIVTDPRRRSIRLDGAPAAGMLARGSRLVPFGRGQTVLTVNAPGAGPQALLRLSWRGLHRSLW